MTADIHFVQGGDEPILIGSGNGTLACACGHVLIRGFEPARFLAIGLQCSRCQAVSTTSGLADGSLPPRSAIIAAPSSTPRMTAMTMANSVTVVGQQEMQRLQALFQPADPNPVYRISTQLLDEAMEVFGRLTGGALPLDPAEEAGSQDEWTGLSDHALGWAVRHLRVRLGNSQWAGLQDVATANAVTHVTAFLHFASTWSRHPLLAEMLQTVSARGFSLHGLAPFAAAHCLTRMGNQIRFHEPLTYPAGIETFEIVTDGDAVCVRTEVFDRFEIPFGRAWEPASLRAVATEAISGAQGQINLRHPGILVLSPGTALAGFDEGLIEAVQASVQLHGRKNRGLMAVAPVVLRLQALADPLSVRFGYGWFPVANRHYRGPGLPPSGGQGAG